MIGCVIENNNEVIVTNTPLPIEIESLCPYMYKIKNEDNIYCGYEDVVYTINDIDIVKSIINGEYYDIAYFIYTLNTKTEGPL